ncbi:PadR family transcriptional regulator [Streptomyces sp. NPDC101151]|uniref:PadR family transcriptional regulator n=1 Tax=Streptomyces sp. NPDC101151 TaxID=3366115 RepID=UPI00381C6DC4
MALRNAVMAALLEGEASGYDLAKGFGSSVANFWMATPQQIYRELERMEGDGLVAARTVQQERRPNKRLYSLTEAGYEAVHAHTAEPPAKPTAIRDELLVKVQCVDVGDLQAVRTSIAQRMELAAAKVVRFERTRERLLAGRTEDEYFDTAERIGPYLTLLRGLSLEEDNLRWGEVALKRLDQRAAALAGLQRGGRPARPQ